MKDWLLTGSLANSHVMINAGLYGIDVSDWKDEDFDSDDLNTELSPCTLVNTSTSAVVGPSVSAFDHPSSSIVVQPSTSRVVLPSTTRVVQFSRLSLLPTTSRVVEPCTTRVVQFSKLSVLDSLNPEVVDLVQDVDISSWQSDDLSTQKSISKDVEMSSSAVVNVTPPSNAQPSTSGVVKISSRPVVQPSTSAVVNVPSPVVVEPSTSAVVNIKSPVVVDPSANLSDVDISSWKDDDFKIPALPFRERKDLKGKIKKSSNVQANNVAKSKVSESPKPVPSSGADDSFSQLDVSAWKDEDFSQK